MNSFMQKQIFWLLSWDHKFCREPKVTEMQWGLVQLSGSLWKERMCCRLRQVPSPSTASHREKTEKEITPCTSSGRRFLQRHRPRSQSYPWRKSHRMNHRHSCLWKGVWNGKNIISYWSVHFYFHLMLKKKKKKYHQPFIFHVIFFHIYFTIIIANKLWNNYVCFVILIECATHYLLIYNVMEDLIKNEIFQKQWPLWICCPLCSVCMQY